MSGQRVHIVMEPELLARVDKAKEPGQSRGAFVRWALEETLGSRGPRVEQTAAAGSIPAGAPTSPRASRPMGKGAFASIPKGKS